MDYQEEQMRATLRAIGIEASEGGQEGRRKADAEEMDGTLPPANLRHPSRAPSSCPRGKMKLSQASPSSGQEQGGSKAFTSIMESKLSTYCASTWATFRSSSRAGAGKAVAAPAASSCTTTATCCRVVVSPSEMFSCVPAALRSKTFQRRWRTEQHSHSGLSIKPACRPTAFPPTDQERYQEDKVCCSPEEAAGHRRQSRHSQSGWRDSRLKGSAQIMHQRDARKGGGAR
eukprot:1193929-Rhodomonas_salina.3